MRLVRTGARKTCWSFIVCAEISPKVFLNWYNRSMTTTIIQAAVPKFRSIRMMMSDDTYASGPAAFFIENIPVAFFTSRRYARPITQFLVEKIAQDTTLSADDRLHLYEFGAGSGLLARNILDLLHAQHPEIYARVIIHLSDINFKTIEAIRQSGIFHAHAGHVQFEVKDMAEADYPADAPPYLVYHTYLAGTLPVRLIGFYQEHIFEVLVSTHLESDAVLLNNAVFPPQPMPIDYVRQLFASDQPEYRDIRQAIGWRVREIMTERHDPLALEASDMTDAEKAELRAFHSSLGFEGTVIFPYCSILTRHIRALAKYPNCSILIQDDFTDTAEKLSQHPEHIGHNMGQAVTHTVFLPLLNYVAQESGLALQMVPVPSATRVFSEESISYAMSLGFTAQQHPHKAALEQSFSTHFSAIKMDEADGFISDLGKAGSWRELDLIETDVYPGLSLDLQNDFRVLTALLNALINFNDQRCLKYARKLIQQYPTLDAPAQLQLATFYIRQRRYTRALACARQALASAPTYARGYNALGYICVELGILEEALTAYTNLVKYSRNKTLDGLVFHMKLCLLAGAPQKAKTMVKHLAFLRDNVNIWQAEDAQSLLKLLATSPSLDDDG